VYECRYRRGFGLVNVFIDHLQVVTTNNYNTIAVSTLYSSLQHTVWCSESVTGRFLVTAPTMPTSLPPVHNSLSSHLLPLATSRHGPCCCSPTVAFLRICCPATGIVPLFVSQERVYRTVAKKRPWYIRPSRGRCVATALHATIL
jgi:hypothetical protein